MILGQLFFILVKHTPLIIQKTSSNTDRSCFLYLERCSNTQCNYYKIIVQMYRPLIWKGEYYNHKANMFLQAKIPLKDLKRMTLASRWENVKLNTKTMQFGACKWKNKFKNSSLALLNSAIIRKCYSLNWQTPKCMVLKSIWALGILKCQFLNFIYATNIAWNQLIFAPIS